MAGYCGTARARSARLNSVKNHVVTLTGDVYSQDARQKVQDVAAAVPNVQQVVNELEVKNRKASASN
ncbi:MAG: BON domain-containing protein [Bryobacteraceae bacterium]